jgi:hypothetical protein
MIKKEVYKKYLFSDCKYSLLFPQILLILDCNLVLRHKNVKNDITGRKQRANHSIFGRPGPPKS